MEKQEINYPWSKAPKWAQWAAIDSNGDAYWYEDKPILRDNDWGGFAYGIFADENGQIYKFRCSKKIDWKLSLQKRPANDNI